MTTDTSRTWTAGSPSGRIRCWVESLILAVGFPASLWTVSRLISISIPAAIHGTSVQRFLLWITGTGIVEWLFLIASWLVLRSRRSSFTDLGVWRRGTWAAWVLALALAALAIGSNLRFLPRMNVPISYVFFPRGFHLVAALLLGITAGFCEEVLFRAFLMTEFAKAGYNKFIQVVIPGVAFGLAHAGYLSLGFLIWLRIAIPTALLGMLWGIAYLLGRRSLIPEIVAHFLNDSTALPWVIFFMVTAR